MVRYDAVGPQALRALKGRIAAVSSPLPGLGPYENQRPIHVAERYRGQTVEAFLTTRFSHVEPGRWHRALAAGEIWWEGKRPARREERVSGGTTLIHRIPGTCEPDVNPQILPLYEDACLLVVAKPAPLPMHPCGRFARNTLVHLLGLAMPDTSIKIVHRLDADTSGVVVLAKTRAAARALVRQFEGRQVRKVYRLGVWGHYRQGRQWFREDPITRDSAVAGTRVVSAQGQACRTRFFCLENRSSRHALLAAYPQGGRTHQIRIHAAQSGSPIVQDPAYGHTPGLDAGLAQGVGRTLMLHAAQITLRHPCDDSLHTFRAPLPAWAKTSDERRAWRELHGRSRFNC